MKKSILPLILLFSFSANHLLADSADSLKYQRVAELEALKPVFKANKGWQDSVFCMVYSDDHLNYKIDYLAADFPGTADQFSKGKKGDIVGPVVKDNMVLMLKLIGKGGSSDSARVRHLLFAYTGAARSSATRTKEQAKSKADSLCNLINLKKVKMEDVVADLTDDPGSKGGNLGDYGWFTKSSGFVQEFKDAGFNNAVGKTVVVETEFGYHIIQVLEQSPPRPFMSAYVVMRYIDWNQVNQMVDMVYYGSDPMKQISFPGGENALQNYMKKNVKYPTFELSHGLVGCTKLELEIDSKGKVVDAYIMMGGLDGTVFLKPSLELAKSLPSFIPAADVKPGTVFHRTLYVNYRKEEYGK